LDLLRLLVGAKADAARPSSVREALRHNQVAMARVLVEAKADLVCACPGKSLLSAAATHLGRDEDALAMAQLLLRAGASVHGRARPVRRGHAVPREWPAWQAIATHKPKTADLLLAAKASTHLTLSSSQRQQRAVSLFALASEQLHQDARARCTELVLRCTRPGAHKVAAMLSTTQYARDHAAATGAGLLPACGTVRHLATVAKLLEAEVCRLEMRKSRFRPFSAADRAVGQRLSKGRIR
jgi:hypothetical protein